MDDWTSDSDDIEEFEWGDDSSSDVELLVLDAPGSSHMDTTGGAASGLPAEVGSSKQKLISDFVAMGFTEELVIKAIEDNGVDDNEALLETLLTYAYTSDVACDEKKWFNLVQMGFTEEEAYSAIQSCGPDSLLVELVDSICTAQLSKVHSEDGDEDQQRMYTLPYSHKHKRMQSEAYETCKLKKRRVEDYRPCKWKKTWPRNKVKVWRAKSKEEMRQNFEYEDVQTCNLPNPMVGFGLPWDCHPRTERKLPEAAIGPPYFYYENVARAPKGVWATISRFLYDIEPEFVDSKFFCAAARKRGYIHNLPIRNRFQLQPLLPLTIEEALPMTKKWWPKWDPRTKLNCLQTCIASAKLTERIRQMLSKTDDRPPLEVQKYVLHECRKWNLVWVGHHKVAPLEPDEKEAILGFPRDHTRGGGVSETERYKSLGNSFQVDTVAYHLSVLKEIFPHGICVLSLFSGIGGAEVALHRLGIHLKTVVSVEISEVRRNIIRSWWEQTGQTGTLIYFADVQQLNGVVLQRIVNTYGCFDLIIGGSPCNNLTGSNRHARDGLQGEHSSLFYEYFRILELVKEIAVKNSL